MQGQLGEQMTRCATGADACAAGLLEFVVKLALLDASHLVELLAGLQVQHSKDGEMQRPAWLAVAAACCMH